MPPSGVMAACVFYKATKQFEDDIHRIKSRKQEFEQ